jgi:phosphatidylcholine synthase
LYTASSVVCGFLALTRIFYDRYRDAFFWLAVAVLIDATDGVLARRNAVSSRLPRFNGAKLDDIVDYVTMCSCRHSSPGTRCWCPSELRCSGRRHARVQRGFNKDDAKTADHFYTGFPRTGTSLSSTCSLPDGPQVNLFILLGLSVLVFMPIRYLYPSRSRCSGGSPGLLLWGILVMAMLWQMPNVSRTVFWLSLVFPIYYVLLSFALDLRRRMVTSHDAHR